jgi:heterodisulfide reductase subunit B/heterodisulfide reductase subunit C
MKVKDAVESLNDSLDYRLKGILNCVQCGRCMGACTATNIYKLAKEDGRDVPGEVYNPRKIIAILRGYSGKIKYTGGPLSESKEPHEPEFLTNISECVQCGLCELYCPKVNSPRDLIKCLQELEGDEGILKTFKEDLMKNGGITNYTISHIFPQLSEEQRGRNVSTGAVRELNDLINNVERFHLEAPREIERQLKNGIKSDVSEIYLFQSCCGSTLYRGMEISARYILDKLGIKVITSDEQTCCGGVPFNVGDLTFLEKVLIGARNLAVIEEALGNDNTKTAIGTCPSCVHSCRDPKHLLSNEKNKKAINDELSTIGRQIDGKVNIEHIVEILHSNIDHIKENVEISLHGFKVAIHSGCHARGLIGEKINYKLHDLVKATGAKIVDYVIESRCCGSGPKIYKDTFASNKNVGMLYTVRAGLNWHEFWGGSAWLPEGRTNVFGLKGKQLRFVSGSLRQTAEKLKYMEREGANIIVVDCPGCEMTFDKNQGTISKKFGKNYSIPTSHITEFLALAMGADPAASFKSQYHSVPIEPVLEKLGVIQVTPP